MTNKDPRKSGSPPESQTGPAQMLNPGDEAPPGTIGTGEDVCPRCHGRGVADGGRCPDCGGTGKIIRAIGGA
ncbi:MAG TPA: hypothetical protein VHA77_02385 [Xanthobacteraceae bacterium]|nr:hypothetical protein [Xanthobacteraceae bacterium]